MKCAKLFRADRALELGKNKRIYDTTTVSALTVSRQSSSRVFQQFYPKKMGRKNESLTLDSTTLDSAGVGRGKSVKPSDADAGGDARTGENKNRRTGSKYNYAM